MLTQYEKDYMSILSSCYKTGTIVKSDDRDIYAINNRTINIDISIKVPIIKSARVDTNKCVSKALELFKSQYDEVIKELSSSKYAKCTLHDEDMTVVYNTVPGEPVPFIYVSILFNNNTNVIDIPELVLVQYILACLVGRYTKTRPMMISILFGALMLCNSDIDLYAIQEKQYNTLRKSDFACSSFDPATVMTEEELKISEANPVIRIKNVNRDSITEESIIIDHYVSFPSLSYSITAFGEKVSQAISESKREEDNNE